MGDVNGLHFDSQTLDNTSTFVRAAIERLRTRPEMEEVWEVVRTSFAAPKHPNSQVHPDEVLQTILHVLHRVEKDVEGETRGSYLARYESAAEAMRELARELETSPHLLSTLGCVMEAIQRHRTRFFPNDETWRLVEEDEKERMSERPPDPIPSPWIAFPGALRFVADNLEPKAIYSNPPLISAKRKDNEITFFIRDLSRRISHAYGQPWHSIVATVTNTVFDLSDNEIKTKQAVKACVTKTPR